MRYPGGKNAGGAYQHIINLIPPHCLYVEAFAGSAAVWRNKLPSHGSVLVEKDLAAAESLMSMVYDDLDRSKDATVLHRDAFDYLPSVLDREDVFVYCDPPYLPETRVKKSMYSAEMSRDDHIRLLDLITSASAMVAISGYDSSLYRDALWDWNHFEYDAITRGRTIRREIIWFNYRVPEVLHDYSYVGRNFTERQRIRRKIDRLQSKLAVLDPVERNAILSGLIDKIGGPELLSSIIEHSRLLDPLDNDDVLTAGGLYRA